MNYFWIGLGSALGGMGRFWISSWLARRYGEVFPVGTLVVNVTGSLLIGFFAAYAGVEGRHWLSPTARQFLMIGLLGGYTTFSSFSLQTLTLMREGQWALAFLNTVGSVILCLVGVWLGHSAGQLLNR